jgi:CheY-like chemotaxis protein
VVDNDLDFRSSVEVLLKARGYTVFAAGSQREAMQLAVRERVHVAVLDVRMESDPDHDDTSGLTLARQLDPLIVKIMVTAYPSVPVVRSSFDDVSALTLVGKDELPQGLLEALSRAFSDKIGLNFDLAIQWQGLQLAEVASNIEVDPKIPSDLIPAEVEEVLCKLFSRADEIVVSPLFPTDQAYLAPQSGAVVLKVQPHYQDGGWAAPVVVKLAAREMIEFESGNYKRYVERYIEGYRRTSLEDRTRTHHLGGIIYTLVGTPLDECLDLGTFYTTCSASEVVRSLNTLFMRTCHLWYRNREPQRTYDLMALYAKPLKLNLPRLEKALHEAGLAEWAGELHPLVPELKRTIINPLEWLRQHPSLTAQVSLAYTHGDLHSRNILIDQNQQAWLIDFYRSGPGHIFRDLIELESDIKFVLLDLTDLRMLYRFEMALVSTRYFDDTPTLPSFSQPELRKAFEVIQSLRHVAGRLVGPHTMMLDYYQGLLLHTLAMIGWRHVSNRKKQHAYMAASLLCQRLNTW